MFSSMEVDFVPEEVSLLKSFADLCCGSNEVIVYRVMMYANPLLIV